MNLSDEMIDDVIKVDFCELEGHDFPQDEPFGLQVSCQAKLHSFIARFSSTDGNIIFVDSIEDPMECFERFDGSVIAYAGSEAPQGEEIDFDDVSEIIDKLSSGADIMLFASFDKYKQQNRDLNDLTSQVDFLRNSNNELKNEIETRKGLIRKQDSQVRWFKNKQVHLNSKKGYKLWKKIGQNRK